MTCTTSGRPHQRLAEAVVGRSDLVVDLAEVVLPEEVIEVRRTWPQPPGILDDHLTDVLRAEVPFLKLLGHA